MIDSGDHSIKKNLRTFQSIMRIHHLISIISLILVLARCEPVNNSGKQGAPEGIPAYSEPVPVVKGDNYDPNNILGDFVYGAVYFRRTNPPPEDWPRDYQTASEDGHNIFRHWFLWGAIEKAPGVYDWSEYDPHMDLAARHGIKVIIAEMLTSAPEWAFEKFDHARLEHRDGTKDYSVMNGASVSGGFPGLSLNDPEVRKAAGKFLTAMAEHYKDHPAMGGYDLANEMKFPQTPNDDQKDYDYSPATQAKFRNWLREKYGDLESLGNAWNRLSYTDWRQVGAPRHEGPYPDVLDWLAFRVDDFHEQVQWRANVIRSADPDHPITTHGKMHSFTHMPTSVNNAWKAAAIGEGFGFTWGAHKKGKAPYQQFHAVDLARSAAGGKPFWHAEAIGGPTWTSKRDRDDGKVVTPEDILLWNMVSFAGGAQGILNPRWRPLLNGVLWGAYGYYGMDGSRTNRSDMASKIAKWGTAPEQKELWEANPVKGEIGIIVVPETQLYAYAYSQGGGDRNAYRDNVFGAYQGFFDNNIQADWVYIDDIDQYDFLYLPFPMMLKEETATKIKQWVVNGGKLVSEGVPGYLSEGGKVGETQPNLGLDEVFGVKESYVEFGANLHEGLSFSLDNLEVPAGLHHQEYEVTTAEPKGSYKNGSVAVADNNFGKGRTRLIGTFPGYGHYHTPNADSRKFFANILSWGEVSQHVKVDAENVTARIHRNGDNLYLWIINHSRKKLNVNLELSRELGSFSGSNVFWGVDGISVKVNGSRIQATVGEHDATILKLL